MEERDPGRRAALLAGMIAIAGDRRQARDYLMKTSMIDALRREGWRGGI